MSYKRLIAACAAAVMCFSAVSCSKSDSSSSGSSSEGDQSQSSAPEKPKEPVVESMGNLDISDYVIESGVDPDFSLEMEAESGTLTGNAAVYTSSFLGEFSGDGFVGGLDKDTDQLELDIEVPADGSYDLIIVSAGDKDGETGSVLVDGNVTSSFTVASSQEWGENKAGNIPLTAGAHKIGFMKNGTSVYIDKVTVKGSEAVDLSDFEVSNQLSNPNANDTTKRLFNFMTDVYGKYIISGNYAGSAASSGMDSREIMSIMETQGDFPAILGLDVGNLSPGAVAHNATTKVIEDAIKWDQKGGIVTLCWHWIPPEDYIGLDGHAWYRGFYAEETNFDLRAALDGSDPKGKELLIRDIDAISEALKQLQDNDIPVLWRPLHEAAGDPKWNNPWFWWGTSGKDAYIELWKLMYDRMTNYHHLNNLIWVWNAQNVDWYPGDEFVDMIGYDIYATEHDYSSQKETFDYIKSATSTNKIITLSENGVIPDPDICMADGARWSWFAVWNGEFTIKDAQLSDQYTSFDMWEKVYKHDRVLTLSELPDLKCYPLDTEAFLASQG